jgi:hypothetical protein
MGLEAPIVTKILRLRPRKGDLIVVQLAGVPPEQATRIVREVAKALHGFGHEGVVVLAARPEDLIEKVPEAGARALFEVLKARFGGAR